jgi:hypothetical protein
MVYRPEWGQNESPQFRWRGLQTLEAQSAVLSAGFIDSLFQASRSALLASPKSLRVSGPDGAAARLRVPPSTLDHRIKKLRIRKSHFKLS